MKKVLIGVLAFLLVNLLFLSTPKVKALESQLDQSCKPHTFSESHITGLDAYQTFKPGQEYLTKIELWLNGQGRYKFQLTRHTTGEDLVSFTLSGPGAGLSKWVDINFGAISLERGRLYAIHLEGIDGAVKWGYGFNDDCYPPGTGVKDGLLIGADWMFQTYGYSIDALTPNPEASLGVITPTPAPGTTAGSTPGPEETTPGVDNPTAPASPEIGQAPSEKTSADIKPPTVVQANYLNFAGKDIVRIDWQKSETAEIEGYRIFRKTAQGQYGQVGVTNKDVRAFDDDTISIGHDYTYMVRSYKQDKESVDSNEATVKVTSAKKLATLTENPFFHSWEALISLLALMAILGLVIWYLVQRRKNKLNSRKDIK